MHTRCSAVLLAGLTVLLGLTATQAPAQTAWRPRPELSDRVSGAVAYDPIRARVVLFGGLQNFTFQNPLPKGHLSGDTWEWDGLRWHHRPTTTAPSPRWGAAMAFDPVRKTVLLFGGDAGGQALENDTWEWDGRVWRKLAPRAAPSPRQHGSMATDPLRKRIVLFGGILNRGGFGQAIPTDETWEWDGTTWSRRAPAVRPQARGAAGLAWNGKTGRVTLFGGGGTFGPVPDDTWEWDGKSWTRLRPGRLPPNASKGGFDLARDPVTGGVLAHGGSPVPETWRWDGKTWTKLNANAGPLRGVVQIVADTARKKVVLFGGSGRNWPMRSLTDTWTFDPGTLRWKLVYDSKRLPLGHLRAVHDAGHDQVLLIGAYVPGQTPLRMWALEGDRLRELKPPRMPPSRQAFALGYHAGSGKVLLFGGCRPSQGCLADTWLWNGKTWSLFGGKLYPPPGGCGPAIYDSRRDKLVIFCRSATQVWEWDPTGWVNRTPSKVPSPRDVFGAAYDPVRQKIVLFGGEPTSPPAGPIGDTWEWDGTSWTQRRPATKPPARSRQGMVYVPWLGGVVMFSGSPFSNTTLPWGDTWLWDGRDWKDLKLPLPSVKIIESAVYDAARARAVAVYVDIRTFSRSPPSTIWYLERRSLAPDRFRVRPGGTMRLNVTLPQQRGQTFVLGLSSATFPAIPLRHVPWVGVERLQLAPDPLLALSLQAGLVRRLDGGGKATFQLAIPGDPRLLWFGFYAAGFAVGPGPSATAITNAVPLEVVK